MNKLTKGSLATGAGLVLLLGGTGTFMSWNATDKTDGGTITNGHLKIDAAATPMWTVQAAGATAPTAMPTGYLAAPGDTIIYEVPVTVDVAGDNLQATFQATSAGLTGEEVTTAFGASAVNVEVIPADAASTTFFGDPTDGVYTLDEGSGSATARIELQFANGGPGAENTAMDKTVTLADLQVALTQTTPTPSV